MRFKSVIIPLILLSMAAVGPIGLAGESPPIDVDDGSLLDWSGAVVQVTDIQGDSSVSMTDLAFVSFDFDDIWLYVRWDLYDNTSYKSGVLYDMGINLSATGQTWDIFVSAEITLTGGLPVIINISIRDTGNNHLWNASDDGNMTEDGSLYLDPTPGLPPNTLSVEARFPLSEIGITTGVVFGSFRSHSSPSVSSKVKDFVPDSGYIILIIDNNPPQVSNLQDTPDPQENGGSVNITVDALDDFGMGDVWVNITYPDSTWTNTSMINGSGNEWSFESTYNDLGIYTYTVWANDTCDNWVTIGPGTFVIEDTDGPFFNNLQDTPDPQEKGGLVNITVDVTDDFAVDTVFIEIIYPDGSSLNVSMMKGQNDQWYYGSQFNDLDVHTYTIWAKDVNNNWNFAGPETFTIQDIEPPYIQNPVALPDPQDMGEDVNITVVVTDDTDVDGVWIEIIYPDGTTVNVTMEPGQDDEWYVKMPFDDLGIHEYIIHANDTSGNSNSTSRHDFLIHDIEKPEIGIPEVTPNPQEEGGDVNISVRITDNDKVDEVWINITFTNGTWINSTMESEDGENWTYGSNFSVPGNYSYTIWASDESGNSDMTESDTFTIDPKHVPGPDQDPDQGPEPSTPAPGIPEKLYLVTLLMFWPLLLMIFTIAIEHRFSFQNRYKRDIKPVVTGLLYNSTGKSDVNVVSELFLLSQRTGIPIEECIVATLVTDVPPQIQDRIQNNILENLGKIR